MQAAEIDGQVVIAEDPADALAYLAVESGVGKSGQVDDAHLGQVDISRAIDGQGLVHGDRTPDAHQYLVTGGDHIVGGRWSVGLGAVNRLAAEKVSTEEGEAGAQASGYQQLKGRG